MRAFKIVGTCLLAAAGVGAAGSQVTVRQGEPPVTQFQSPMILEVPVPSPLGLAVGSGRSTTPDLKKFACDGVTISSVNVTLSRHRGGPEGTLLLELSGTLHVPPSSDRRVDLVLVVREGETVLGRGERRKIDAEEDRQTKFRTKLTLNQTAYEAAFSEDPQPVLEITMAVVGNG